MKLKLLANSNVHISQRISAPAAAAPSGSAEDSITEDYLKSITYDSVTSVLRQCDRSKTFNSSMCILAALHESSATNNGLSAVSSGKREKKRLSQNSSTLWNAIFLAVRIRENETGQLINSWMALWNPERMSLSVICLKEILLIGINIVIQL